MKETKINIGNSQKETIITNELKIGKNVFIYNKSMVPLANISRINVESAPQTPYHLSYFVMIFVGLICLFAKSATLIALGLGLIILGGFIVYSIYKRNQKLGEYLVLNLNSGKDIYLYSNNHNFTIEIMDVIINCINSGKEYRINMENCKIEACQFGERNMMNREV